MAIQQNEPASNSSSSFLLVDDNLYCEEEKWEESENDEGDDESYTNNPNGFSFLPPMFNLLEQDLFWEDGELLYFFTKEKEQKIVVKSEISHVFTTSRQEAIEWMLKVHAHYNFTTLTAILAINFLDRFLSTFHYQNDKPWMIQLVAVACLSLAAKVEETYVPLLLDLQVEDTKFVFEAKTIQRMELLVLSTLKWKMHPVTPLSFLDHIIRRLGLKNNLHWEFLKRCENLLLDVVYDSKSINYLPSELATATMMYVIDQVEPFNPVDYQNQLLSVLKISKENVSDCYELILEVSKRGSSGNRKRKFEPMPSSPSGVIDAVFSGDSSNDSWGLSSNLSVVSSPEEPIFKKSRTQDQWVFVDIVGNSPH